MFTRISENFDEAYLAQLRKSDFEVIAELLVRDIRLVRVLPTEQRTAIANLLRDKADSLEMIASGEERVTPCQ
jgi:hypothetical protein